MVTSDPEVGGGVRSLVGYVMASDGIYGPDKVEVTLTRSATVHRGEYLLVELDGRSVMLQAENVYVKRQTSSYDEKLVRDGVIREDEERVVAKAVCWQVGYLEAGELKPYLHPIPPLTPVYRPSEQELGEFITPDGPSISIGTMYPTSIPLRLDLRRLFRQGALIIGGIGTGKSTLMLTLMVRMLQTVRSPHLLLIDWDGEYNTRVLGEEAERAGGYLRLTAPLRLARRANYLSPTNAYNKLRQLSGRSANERIMRALYAVAKQLEENGVQAVEWSRAGLAQLVERVADQALRREAEEIVSRVVGESQGGEVDIVEAVRSNALVHIDMSGAQSWDEIVNTAREAVEECYREARTDQSFGVAVFIDEVHNFVPQSPSEGAASRQAYEEMIPVMKLVATTGPRNGVPLFIATQRLSEADKFVTTQMGQNIFAFRVEDVDMLRLREIVGSDIAYTARTLPRGHCIYKGHALRVQRPVIAVVEKAGDVASVGKDLLTRWTQG
jgi:DNA helicase HerA-like ATPase